mmetsp:Transcript_58506/g.110129  ORF Transcript_58506/g.110129 Transcript_58506/m.110129 type:complete len:249 (+) Transcript_58506:49-795(+)
MAQSVTEAVASRFSCRQFLPDKVPDESLLRDLLTKAARASSDGNCQPWRVYVLSGDAKNAVVDAVQNAKTAMSEYHNYPDQPASSNIVYDDEALNKKTAERLSVFRKTKYSERRKVCGNMLYTSIKVPKDDLQGKLKQLAKNAAFFGAPVGLIVTVDRVFDRPGWGSVGMFLATFALLCEEAGLSTCFQGYFGVNHVAVKQALPQINGEEEIIWCGVSVGYADRDAPINSWRTERASLDNFATFLSKL